MRPIVFRNNSGIMRPLAPYLSHFPQLRPAVLVRQHHHLRTIKSAVILGSGLPHSSILNHTFPPSYRITHYHSSARRMAVHNLAESGFGAGTNELYDR
jgi:hypothetical protein